MSALKNMVSSTALDERQILFGKRVISSRMEQPHYRKGEAFASEAL